MWCTEIVQTIRAQLAALRQALECALVKIVSRETQLKFSGNDAFTPNSLLRRRSAIRIVASMADLLRAQNWSGKE